MSFRSQNTAHTMHTEGIEGIIILVLRLHYGYHEEADDGVVDSHQHPDSYRHHTRNR